MLMQMPIDANQQAIELLNEDFQANYLFLQCN